MWKCRYIRPSRIDILIALIIKLTGCTINYSPIIKKPTMIIQYY